MLESIPKIKADFGLENNGRVQRYFTQRCQQRMDKYIPMREGALRREVTMTPNSITYEVPYAHAQYVGIINGKPINPDNYTTPGTGPYWDKRMVSAEYKQLLNECQEYLIRRSK